MSQTAQFVRGSFKGHATLTINANGDQVTLGRRKATVLVAAGITHPAITSFLAETEPKAQAEAAKPVNRFQAPTNGGQAMDLSRQLAALKAQLKSLSNAYFTTYTAK